MNCIRRDSGLAGCAVEINLQFRARVGGVCGTLQLHVGTVHLLVRERSEVSQRVIL